MRHERPSSSRFARDARARAWPALVLAGILAFAAEARAHGGRYRNPSIPPPPAPPEQFEGMGRVPETGRVPKDPGSGSDGGSTEPPAAPGFTPPPIGGVTRGGPRVGPRSGAPGATPGARAGATPRSKRASGPSPDGWEVWWEHNQAPLLNLRERLAERAGISGSADWLLGRRPRDRSFEATRPTRLAVRRTVLPIVERALADRFFDVRASAVIAFGKCGDPEALPVLVRALADPHPQVSESAALALGILGDPSAVPGLVALARDTREGARLVARSEVPVRTRAFAAVGLGMIGDAASVPELIETASAAHGAHLDIPVAAVTALGLFEDAPQEVPLFLADLLRDRRRPDLVRSAAAVSLGRLGDPGSVPALRRALRDRALDVRRSAVIALGGITAPGDRITVSLLRGLVRKGRDPLSRHWACIALGRIGDPVALETLAEAALEGTGPLRAYGALGLALLGRDASGGVAGRVLRRGLREARDASTLGAFAIASGILGDRSAIPDLARLLRGHRSPALRGHAALALGMLQAKEAAADIRGLLDDSRHDPRVHKDAAIALGLVGDVDVLEQLAGVLARARTEYVQSAAALALGFIGDRSVVPLLERIASDAGRPGLARAHAVVALGVVGEAGRLPALHVLAIDSNYRALVAAIEEILTIT